MAAKFVRTDITLAALVRGIFPQFCNMMLLYTFLGLLNRRSRRLGDSAARQVNKVALHALHGVKDKLLGRRS